MGHAMTVSPLVPVLLLVLIFGVAVGLWNLLESSRAKFEDPSEDRRAV